MMQLCGRVVCLDIRLFPPGQVIGGWVLILEIIQILFMIDAVWNTT